MTSIGCQARSGSSPGASALWFPRSISTAACARCATFWWAWKIVSLSPGVGGRREAHRHALREERAVVRARQEVAPAAADDAEAVGHRREHVLQRAAARPPELVRIRVDHPVGAVVGRREPRHPGDPRVLAHVVGRLADEPQDAGALVPLEDLRRPVARRVVDRQDEVDAGMEMECDLRVDDVCLVPREERHHEPHPTGSPTISSAASTTRSAARPSTVPTTCSTARRRAAASSSGCASERSMPATTSSKRSAR